ncbi:EPM2A-interacting protein 1-like [Aphis craccivora]|uniref:EPM2A-interacting protein 1-like n=1 Tax=Aphis craccivora TaxID=307492 RepID=A0A6G0XM30_APHCR|nr:EPM2A-interacting protein 1-like [Aphis craccivora]
MATGFSNINRYNTSSELVKSKTTRKTKTRKYIVRFSKSFPK